MKESMQIQVPAQQYDSYQVLSPEEIGASFPAWQEDIERLQPWERPDGTDFWSSAQNRGDRRIILTGPCSSILDLGWRFIADGHLEEGDCALAVSQFCGRGQKGRSWISPAGNLYAALRLELPGRQWQNLASLLTGYILAVSLSELGWNIQIKWPNDLLFQGKKTGGILIEAKDSCFLAGIGLNLVSAPSDEELGDEMAMPAGPLYEDGMGLSPLSLWLLIARRTGEILRNMVSEHTPQEFLSLLKPYLAFLNKNVTVIIPAMESFQAVFTGLDSNGGIRLYTANGEKTLMSAEIFPI